MKSTERLCCLLEQLEHTTELEREVLSRAVGAIDDEVFDNYMKLPTDIGGKPLHIGDYIIYDKQQYTVSAIAQDGNVVITRNGWQLHTLRADKCIRMG